MPARRTRAGRRTTGPQVRALEQVRRRLHRSQDRVEAGSLVHQRQRLGDQRLEELRGLCQGLLHPVRAEDRWAVARAQGVGVERRHRTERDRPLARVALHLLRVARVRSGPDEEVPRAEHAARRHPDPGRVVRLAQSVAQGEGLAPDDDVHRRGVGDVGRPEALRPRRRHLELARVDAGVVAARQRVALEPRRHPLVRDDARRLLCSSVGVRHVEVAAIDVAARVDQLAERYAGVASAVRTSLWRTCWA